MKHRGEASQAHLALVRSREALVSSRTKLVNHIRGTVKSFGSRLPKCSAQSFHKKAAADTPKPLKPALEPLLETIENPERFQTSRMVGAYAGLVPARHQSGESDPQKRISKRGDLDIETSLG